MTQPQKSGKGWLWAVAAMLLVGGGATAAVLLTQNGDDDEATVAASDEDSGFRSNIGGDFGTNPKRTLFELDDIEGSTGDLTPGFGTPDSRGSGNGGVRYVDPKFGYVLLLPAGMPKPQDTGEGAVVSAGTVDGKFIAVAAVAIPIDKSLSNAELKEAAEAFAIGLGGKAIEVKRYRVFGLRTWGGIYEKDDGFRVEAIFYPADGYVISVSIGTQSSDFAATESFRRDFFKKRVLPN